MRIAHSLTNHPCTRIKPIKHTTKGSQRSNWQRINPPRSKHKNTNYNQPNNSSHRPGPHCVDTMALHHKSDDESALCGDGNPSHLRLQRSLIWDCPHNPFPPPSSLQTLALFTLHAAHRCALATMTIALTIPWRQSKREREMMTYFASFRARLIECCRSVTLGMRRWRDIERRRDTMIVLGSQRLEQRGSSSKTR